MNETERLCINLGERRRLVLSVSVDGAKDFTLSNPSYKLTGQGEMAEGVCEMSDHDLAVYIQPSFPGWYALTVSFDLVTGEHILRKVKIFVSDE